MSVSPVSHHYTRRQKPLQKQQPVELTLLLIDLTGLPATHALSAARTLSAIRGAPEFEARQLITCDQLPPGDQTRLGYYMIQSGAVICRIIFRSRPGQPKTAMIDAADCYTAYPHIHPRSYALFYTMAQLLENLGFTDVRLTADEDAGRFFKTLGFRRSRRRTDEMRATPVEIADAAAAIFT
jgi:hypothetical protein